MEEEKKSTKSLLFGFFTVTWFQLQLLKCSLPKSAGCPWPFHHDIFFYLCLFSIFKGINQSYPPTFYSSNNLVSLVTLNRTNSCLPFRSLFFSKRSSNREVFCDKNNTYPCHLLPTSNYLFILICLLRNFCNLINELEEWVT